MSRPIDEALPDLIAIAECMARGRVEVAAETWDAEEGPLLMFRLTGPPAGPRRERRPSRDELCRSIQDALVEWCIGHDVCFNLLVSDPEPRASAAGRPRGRRPGTPRGRRHRPA